MVVCGEAATCAVKGEASFQQWCVAAALQSHGREGRDRKRERFVAAILEI